MIKFIEGDLFSQNVDAIGHGVNCMGAMGSGIAVEFRKRFPDMYLQYRILCGAGTLTPGHMFPYRDEQTNWWVYNLASQDYPGASAKGIWLRESLKSARLHAETNGLHSVALPRIAAGIGGLSWDIQVKPTMEAVLAPSRVQFTIVSLPEA